MKKIIAIMFAVSALLTLAACGEDESADIGVIGGQDGPTVVVTATPVEPEATPEPAPVSTPEATPEATPEPTPEPTPDPTPEPTPEPTPKPMDALDAKAAAESLIGESIDALYAAIGEPASSDYAPSCLGPGEDGNLYYDGFVVYTYREDGMETVEYVE